jgi:hypothetical protein
VPRKIPKAVQNCQVITRALQLSQLDPTQSDGKGTFLTLELRRASSQQQRPG